MNYGKFIWVKVLNDSNESFDILENQVRKILRQQYKKFSPTQEALKNALWNGAYALRNKAEECAERAKERGILLYCWSGTKVLEGMSH